MTSTDAGLAIMIAVLIGSVIYLAHHIDNLRSRIERIEREMHL